MDEVVVDEVLVLVRKDLLEDELVGDEFKTGEVVGALVVDGVGGSGDDGKEEIDVPDAGLKMVSSVLCLDRSLK